MEMNKGKVSLETDHNRLQALDSGNLTGNGILPIRNYYFRMKQLILRKFLGE